MPGSAQANSTNLYNTYLIHTVCAVIMKHLNAQYLTIALSFVTILHTALVSWTDIVQGLKLFSFVDRHGQILLKV